MGVRIKLNRKGLGILLKSSDIGGEMLRRGERVAAQAKSNAPVVSGTYRASIVAELDDHPSRVACHVKARVPYAQKVEADHRTLGRSLDAAKG